MAPPHVLDFAPQEGHPSGLVGPLDPARVVAHLTVMTTKKAKKAPGGDPEGQVLSVVDSVLSLSELCAQLQVTAQTIYDLHSQGRGPRGLRVGRELRFGISEMDA